MPAGHGAPPNRAFAHVTSLRNRISGGHYEPETGRCGTVIGGETSTLDLHIVVSHGGPVTDYVSLVDDLRAAGATVPCGHRVTALLHPRGPAIDRERGGCSGL